MNAPPVLLPYQQAWIADPSPLKVDEKSRRTGLTWAEAADNVLIAGSSRSAGGMNVYYIAYNQDMTVEYIQACAMWAQAFNRAASEVEEGFWEEDEEDRHIKTYTIRFPDSGFRIVALSSRPANLRGRQGVIVIDEAAFHDDLPGLLKAALALLIWGGKVRIISTHNGEDNAFNELIKEIRSGKRQGTVHRITFREAVAQGLFKRVCLRTGQPWTPEAEAAWVESVYAFYGADAAEELDVIPRMGSGAYFTRILLEQCMAKGIPVLRWAAAESFVTDENRLRVASKWLADHLKPVLDALPGLRSVYGQDFGRDGDLSVIWVLQKTGGEHWRMAFAVELRKMPFDVQALIRDFILDNLPLFHHAKFDARGNGQSHAEGAMQKYGATRVECVKATVEWYSLYFPKYRAAYEDKSITIAESEDTIADHRRVVLVKGRPTMDDGRDKGSDGGYRHGDSAIAGLMAWAATLAEGGPIEFESTGNLRASLGAYQIGRDHSRQEEDDTFGAVAGDQDFDGWEL
jgi:phage FluMu gp28-like protein